MAIDPRTLMTPQSDSSDPSCAELSERSRRVLAGLVKQYIEAGEPVSSRWLAEHTGLGRSSATVRQMMAKLEERGYVHQPHTSSGRVPTDLGYRAYVDLLLESPRAAGPAPEVEARLRKAVTVNDILSNVSHELSQASHQLGFALLPVEEGTFRHIEFAPLEGTRILVIVSTSHVEVAHKVVDLGSPVAASDLRQGANYLNTEFAGRPLHTVRAAMVEQLRHERILYDALLSRALKLASSTLDEMVTPASVFLEGASFLIEDVSDATDHAPLSTLRALLAMIEHKDRLLRILTAYIEGPGLTVRIGTEHQSPEMQDFGLVMSTYSDGQRTGGVGVIGLRRMRYSRAIATVDRVSRAVSRVLVEPQARPPDHERRDET